MIATASQAMEFRGFRQFQAVSNQGETAKPLIRMMKLAAVSPFRDIAPGISGRYWTLVHCRVLPARATVPSAILDCAAAFDRMSVVDSARGMSAYHKVTVDSDASVPAAALLGALVDAMECHASQR